MRWRRKWKRAMELVLARRYADWIIRQREKGNVPPGGWIRVYPPAKAQDVIFWLDYDANPRSD